MRNLFTAKGMSLFANQGPRALVCALHDGPGSCANVNNGNSHALQNTMTLRL
jgi:hypothetical protein